ncbi:caspase family protein [Methyloceanibacter sp.]|uniref:caspase family protein n=1 Tax=Methyloceanibacter sp. TaxID=1965321 RepID=UPI003D6C907F
MLKHFAACLVGLAALLVALAPAAAEKRVALVIGNAAYENVPRLQNPSNDASDIAAKLRGLGFDVVEGVDLGKRDMEKRIRAFAEQLSGADVGLFYYAGHGLQVDQRNFLAPVDAQLKSETDLDFEAVQLDLVLKQMVRNARTSIVFLDACRDNPLATNLAQVSRSLDIGRGLARVEAAASMMIVYSTEPGKVALDGTGRNSPFTAALLRHIDSEGESISDVMIDVRNDVLNATGGKQRPFESASLTGQFFFKPAFAKSADTSPTTAEIGVLRDEIAKLQADQGALLKSQQEQLALLQKKLAEETKPSEAAAPQPSVPAPGTDSRVIAVEPAGGGTNSAPATTSASDPSQAANAAAPEEATKLATAETTGAEEATPEAAKATEAPLPQGASRQELAQDMLVELKRIGCYFGSINGNWGARSQLALERFNRQAVLELPLDEPQQASLDTLKAWKGPRCAIEQAVPPRFKQRPVVVAPKKNVPPPRKAVRAPPRTAPPVQALRPPPRPQDHGSDEQRELQRAFPSTAWPGQ